jgi:hypothetical protein
MHKEPHMLRNRYHICQPCTVLVKRGLPDADELRKLDTAGLPIVVEPAGANSREESFQGYLTVLQKN